jgi:DNA adenine methylase
MEEFNIKYVGSKNRISKDLVPIIQECINENDIHTYFEPFVGGANIIDKIKCDNCIGNDINQHLIALLKAIQNGWNPLESVTMTKEFYDNVKNNKSKYSKKIVGLCGLCATYNAKWFGGYAGIVHTKIDTYRNYYEESVNNILKQKVDIQNVKFISTDYLTLDETKMKNWVIYCDPPYAGTTKYSTGGFEYDVFWQWVRDVSKNNFVFVSEYNAPKDFKCIWNKKLTTTLDKNSRNNSVEKLFVYKDIKS